MKLPRDLAGDELVTALARLGYVRVRQRGSHMRLRTLTDGEHEITVPEHRPLRIGTLNSMLRDLESHRKLS